MIVRLTLLFSLLVSLSAKAQETIRIGSKEFPESHLLAEIMAQLIESHPAYTVERNFGLGGTLICFEALQQDEIDLYPEYTGTGLRVLLQSDTQLVDPDVVLAFVDSAFHNRFDLRWLPAFGFNNTYALAVSATFPAQTLSELQAYPDLQIAFTHEFLNREDGFPGLAAHYGFHWTNVRGMEHGLVYKAMKNGQVDLTDAYSTDGQLVAFDLKLLKDDRGFFPQYYGAPMVRQQSLDRYPELTNILAPLTGSIDEATMQRLNYEVEVNHRSFAEVAGSFLIENGWVTPDEVEERSLFAPLLESVLEHMELTFIATLLAVLLGVPLSMLILGHTRVANTVLTITGLVQTIPSLALLGFLIPLLGIGFGPAIVALFLYALLPIVRNTYTGLQSIDPVLIEAGWAMGMTRNQLLLRVRLPLAARFILAGIRTATVINIGTATLAAFIGAGGLGEFILTGITLNDNQMILQGAIPAALLALVTDRALGYLEKRLEPRGLRTDPSS